MRVFLVVGCLLSAVSSLSAADPVRKAAGPIIVSKGVTGDGKRLTPFEFDASTKCVLTLPTAADGIPKGLEWDLEDGPPDAEAIGDGGQIVVFSLGTPGLYQVSARWDGGWAKAWLRIKGPNGPPDDPDKPSLGQRITAALVGPNAKADALKLAAICDQIGEELAGASIKDTGDLFAAWEAAFSGDNKLTGKYPDLANILRDALPPAGDPADISDTDRKRFIQTFKDIATAAKGVANG